MDNKIKVLFRHRSMEMGGVEKVLLSIINHLDQDKFETTVLLNLNQGELRDEFPPHVKKITLAKGREEMSQNPLIQKVELFQRSIKLKKFMSQPALIDENILKEKYDIEVAMTYNDFPLVLNSTNKESKKIGWFHSEINLKGFEPLVPNILKSFPKFHHMVYCSQKIADLMHENHPTLDYPKESVITNAIPAEEIKIKALETVNDFPKNHLPIFVSIGRLHTRKGYHTLMNAHARLIKDGFPHQIIIVGDGEEKQNLLHQRAELGAENTFLLLGNKMNPYPYLKNSDFFILPSKSEAWPLVLAEALILQKPTIATDCGDVADVLDHDKTGLLILHDEDEMYHAMKRFLTEPTLIKSFQENLKSIDEKFDNQKIFKKIESLLENIIKD